MNTAEEINELKALVKRLNDKLGLEGVGFTFVEGRSNYRVDRAISLLKVVAESIGA